MLENILLGIKGIADLSVLLGIFVGTIAGLIFGALPGISSTMSVAILIPFCFKLSPQAGLSMLGAVYCSSIYGGSISAILLRTPGTGASVCTSWEGFELTKRGFPGRALGISTAASGFGGIFSAICLLFIAPALANFALRFGPPEKFFLVAFGFSVIISASSESIFKGLIAGFFGLLIATTGIELVSGEARFIWGRVDLYDGIPLLPALIGMISITQALNLIETEQKSIQVINNKLSNIQDRIIPTFKDIKRVFNLMIRSSIIGTIIGIIPGIGTDTAAFMAYTDARRSTKYPEEFGRGNIDGVAGPETANNAVSGGSLIPLLTLGIPGNSVAAIFFGGLMIYGLVPGQRLFTQDAKIAYTLMISLILSNIAFVIIGFITAKAFVNIVKIPINILAPIIITFSVIGSYALRNSVFDVVLMFVFGILGYFFEKAEIPIIPIIMALILGPLAEKPLRQTLLMQGGNFFLVFKRPICVILFVIIVLNFCKSLLDFIKIKSCKKQ